MTRKEVCAKIRDLNLQEEVKAQFGDNYTRISTDKLEQLVNSYSNTIPAKPVEAEATITSTASDTKGNACGNVEVDNPFEAACLTFLGLLKDMNLLNALIRKL